MREDTHRYGNGHADAHKSPERLQHEVDQTRHRIEERLDALSSRLSPGELLDQTLGVVRRQGGEMGQNLGEHVRNNPLPLILTGVGLAWLMKSTTEPHYGYQAPARAGESRMDKAREGMNQAREGMSHAREGMSQARDRMGERADEMRHSMESAAERARWRAQETQAQLNGFLRDQPVLAASLGIALGAALGALFPETRTEDRMLGEMSDRTKDKAREAGNQQYDKLREKAREEAGGQQRSQEASQERDASANRSARASAPPGTGGLSSSSTGAGAGSSAKGGQPGVGSNGPASEPSPSQIASASRDNPPAGPGGRG